jgi:hypothetical protein
MPTAHKADPGWTRAPESPSPPNLWPLGDHSRRRLELVAGRSRLLSMPRSPCSGVSTLDMSPATVPVSSGEPASSGMSFEGGSSEACFAPPVCLPLRGGLGGDSLAVPRNQALTLPRVGPGAGDLGWGRQAGPSAGRYW